ncbi:MAG: hypothetical protein JRC77_03775, partial [Deltaproteobacteria bacterium]|nr:hypothetical protein [Deltaproteobacteria bacterium]
MSSADSNRSVDVRTRIDKETPELDPSYFFEQTFPNALRSGRDRILPGARQLDLPAAFSVEVDGRRWTTYLEDSDIKIIEGQHAGAARVR